MGDRYTLDLSCIYCGELNKDVWFAPTCGFYTFGCSKCGKRNFIKSGGFVVKKVEEVTDDEVIAEFFNASNVGWDKEQQKMIEKSCREEAEKIRRLNEEKN